MSKPKLAIFDFDLVSYRSSFAGETRNVEVTHTPSGRKMMFKNMTEFKGRSKKKTGGWLGKLNEDRLEKGLQPFDPDEFELETIRTVDELPKVLHTTKVMIRKMVEQVGAEHYVGYLGKGNGFRYDLATLLEYKGNRKDALRPLLKDEVNEYIFKHHNATMESHFEADDRVIMEAIKYGIEDSVVISIDKDSMGCPVRVYNPNKPEQGIINCNQFGRLDVVGNPRNRKVEGVGRLFLYFQVLFGDPTDNYKSNCMSDVEWGEVSACNALKDCKTDRDAFMVLKESFQMLYPEPKEVVGWRGDTILIDWQYVIREMWNMARMRRHEKDDVDIIKVMENLGVL